MLFTKLFRLSLLVGILAALSACEKTSDRCECIDTNDDSSFETSVEDQECSDLNNSQYNCYPAD